MEGPFNSKRPLEATTTDPSAKRRHFQTASGDAVFRILCPSSKTSSLLLLLGNITGATIRIDDSTPSSEERVLLILSSKSNKDNGADTEITESEESSSKDSRPGQQALVRVFETMVRMDEDKETDSNSNSNGFGFGFGFGMCCCRLLVGSNQVGSVIGRGGKIVEKIRIDTGAHIRVLPKDHIPSCASPGDELIQITGNFSAVKKALLSVSSCLQDNPRADACNSSATKPSVGMHHGVAMPSQVDPFPQRGYASGHHAADYHSRGYSFVPGPENIGAAHRMFLEEEVVFKLLCQIEKVGSLIGKGGSIIRALQNETGASIKIADAAPDSDERVVVISARENSEQKHSPAQEAVIRVHCRIAEIGFEPGAAIVGRLLVHSQQIGCLLGKGGFIITEMRRATGASIRIFPKEQVPKCGSPNDEVVQVIGSLQSVQDALFHITSRLRETIFPMKPPPPNFSGPPYLSPFPEIPPPLFRPRHNPASPGNYPSPVGHPHAIDRSAIPSQPLDHQPAFSYGMDRSGPPNMDRVPYPYGGEIPGHGPTFERPSSPRFWAPQAVNSGNHRGTADVLGLASKNGSLGSGNQVSMLTSSTVEITIPQTLLSHVHGENNSNLTQIRQISSAKVVVHDPKPGATEGVVMVSGTPDHVRAAQSLIQAFILCGQTPS